MVSIHGVVLHQKRVYEFRNLFCGCGVRVSTGDCGSPREDSTSFDHPKQCGYAGTSRQSILRISIPTGSVGANPTTRTKKLKEVVAINGNIS